MSIVICYQLDRIKKFLKKKKALSFCFLLAEKENSHEDVRIMSLARRDIIFQEAKDCWT